MIYIRGNRLDYDDWAARGRDGWGYEDVLPYFRRAEDNTRGESRYHGVGGPLRCQDGRSLHPLVDAFIAPRVEPGMPAQRRLQRRGAGRRRARTSSRSATGARCSTASRTCDPRVARGNLDVITDAHVRASSSRATARRRRTSRRRREELRRRARGAVCGGAYHSPQLLMLSGIGPAAHLAPMGIEVRQDPRVGEGLQDHPVCSLQWLSNEPSMLAAFSPEAAAQYEADASGPLSSNVGEGCTFLRSSPISRRPTSSSSSGRCTCTRSSSA